MAAHFGWNTHETKRPDAGFVSNGEVTGSNGDLISGKFYVAGGSDKIRASLAAFRLKDDGFDTNILTGDRVNNRDDWSVRGKLLCSSTMKTS